MVRRNSSGPRTVRLREERRVETAKGTRNSSGRMSIGRGIEGAFDRTGRARAWGKGGFLSAQRRFTRQPGRTGRATSLPFGGLSAASSGGGSGIPWMSWWTRPVLYQLVNSATAARNWRSFHTRMRSSNSLRKVPMKRLTWAFTLEFGRGRSGMVQACSFSANCFEGRARPSQRRRLGLPEAPGGEVGPDRCTTPRRASRPVPRRSCGSGTTPTGCPSWGLKKPVRGPNPPESVSISPKGGDFSPPSPHPDTDPRFASDSMWLHEIRPNGSNPRVRLPRA